MNKLILILATLSLTACGFEIVDTGNRGIETRFGQVVGETLPEGLHFYNPFTSDIKEFSVREEKFEAKTSIFTKDTQRTDVTFAVTWSMEPKYVGELYKTIGDQGLIEQKVLQPVVLGSIKDAVGLIIADDLISKREMATKNALDTIRKNLLERHISVSDLQFVNIDFDDAYETAVEEKVVAIQRAQKAKNETVTVEEQARQTVLSAKADAESMRIKSQALAENKGLVEFEIAQKWDGKLPQYMMGNSVPMINFEALKK